MEIEWKRTLATPTDQMLVFNEGLHLVVRLLNGFQSFTRRTASQSVDEFI
jgi:hypothetical protein